MNLDALLAERFGAPVRTDRPRNIPGDIRAVIAEQDTPLPRIEAGWSCQWAGCKSTAGTVVDGWSVCLRHAGVKTKPDGVVA